MKKPFLTLAGVVVVSATSLAYLGPSGAGGQDHGTQVLDGAAKAGLVSSAVAKTVKSDQTNAAARAQTANAAMSPEANRQPAAAQAQQAPPQAQSGKPAPTATPPTEERRVPRWRLEGVMVGGKARPSAVFIVEGWGEAVLHVGEKLNEDAKIVSINSKGVSIRSKDKKVQLLTPW